MRTRLFNKVIVFKNFALFCMSINFLRDFLLFFIKNYFLGAKWVMVVTSGRIFAGSNYFFSIWSHFYIRTIFQSSAIHIAWKFLLWMILVSVPLLFSWYSSFQRHLFSSFDLISQDLQIHQARSLYTFFRHEISRFWYIFIVRSIMIGFWPLFLVTQWTFSLKEKLMLRRNFSFERRHFFLD